MAGNGPAPKPPGQRRRRNAPAAGEWVDLPRDGRHGPAPKWPLPPSTQAERGLWQRVWRTPQATMWEGAGVGIELTVARYVRLTLTIGAGGMKATELMASLPELRQIEDRLGLNPKGMQDRRWRIAEADGDEERGGQPAKSATVTAMADYRNMVEGL